METFKMSNSSSKPSIDEIRNYLYSFLECKLENDSGGDPKFVVSNVSNRDLKYLYHRLHQMEQEIRKTPDYNTYLNENVWDVAWEIYESLDGRRNSGFFNHCTPEGNEIQELLDQNHRYDCECWEFELSDKGYLILSR